MGDYICKGGKALTFAWVKVLILSGPSAAGKTTLAQALLACRADLVLSLSATTRPPRPGEVHGRDYYFLSMAEFEARIAAGDFLEWEELYGGYRYGTLRSELARFEQSGQIPILVKDVKGALKLRQILGQAAITVFVLPPSLEAIRERLLSRGIHDARDLEDRLRRIELEMQMAPQFDAILYNDELERAVHRLLWLLERYFAKV